MICEGLIAATCAIAPGFSTSAGVNGAEISFIVAPKSPDFGAGLVLGQRDAGEASFYVELEALAFGDVHGSTLLGATAGAGPVFSRGVTQGWQATVAGWAALPLLPFLRHVRLHHERPRTEFGVMAKIPFADFD